MDAKGKVRDQNNPPYEIKYLYPDGKVEIYDVAEDIWRIEKPKKVESMQAKEIKNHDIVVCNKVDICKSTQGCDHAIPHHKNFHEEDDDCVDDCSDNTVDCISGKMRSRCAKLKIYLPTTKRRRSK